MDQNCHGTAKVTFQNKMTLLPIFYFQTKQLQATKLSYIPRDKLMQGLGFYF
jgi:hypothetical protein